MSFCTFKSQDIKWFLPLQYFSFCPHCHLLFLPWTTAMALSLVLCLCMFLCLLLHTATGMSSLNASFMKSGPWLKPFNGSQLKVLVDFTTWLLILTTYKNTLILIIFQPSPPKPHTHTYRLFLFQLYWKFHILLKDTWPLAFSDLWYQDIEMHCILLSFLYKHLGRKLAEILATNEVCDLLISFFLSLIILKGVS